jgi:hypothetical protein
MNDTLHQNQWRHFSISSSVAVPLDEGAAADRFLLPVGNLFEFCYILDT